MKTIDVCLSPELMFLYDVSDKTVVVVDIFRATSCMVTAFAHGAEAIKPFPSLEDCRLAKKMGYEISGERNGEKVEGFDKGNSPFEYMGSDILGKRIAFTTTNGTQAIEKAKDAKELLIGSFLNITATKNKLVALNNSVLLVCAGWKGRFNLEDTLFAGALALRLKDHFTYEDDSVLASCFLYQEARNNMLEFLKLSSHVQRLNRLNIHKDIEFCLTEDLYSVVPNFKNGLLVL